MNAWALRWRSDATGFVAKFAGQIAGAVATFDAADEIRRDMPNGDQIEIIPVPTTPAAIRALSVTPEGEKR